MLAYPATHIPVNVPSPGTAGCTTSAGDVGAPASCVSLLLPTTHWPTWQWQILPEFPAAHLRCLPEHCPCAVTTPSRHSWHQARRMLCLAWPGVVMLVGNHLPVSYSFFLLFPLQHLYLPKSSSCYSCWQLFFLNPPCNSSVTAQPSLWLFSSLVWHLLGTSPPDRVVYFCLFLPIPLFILPFSSPPIYLTRWWYASHLPRVGCAGTHRYAYPTLVLPHSSIIKFLCQCNFFFFFYIEFLNNCPISTVLCSPIKNIG